MQYAYRILQAHTQFALRRGAGLGVILTLLAPPNYPAEGRDNSRDYAHATTRTGLVGYSGSVLMLLLAQKKGCANLSDPHLEIDIRELPLAARKRIRVGPDNWAFRCPNLKEACEQALSGTVVFDELATAEDADHHALRLNDAGHYELKFKNREVESGHFKVDCYAP